MISDVVDLWRKSSLAVIEAKSAQNKLKNVIKKLLTARKRAKKFKCSIIEDWFDKLFDLFKCWCDILETVGTYRGKLLCTCKFDNRIPEKEMRFLKDQRSSRKTMLSESKDMVLNKHRRQVFAKTQNNAETDQEQPICSKRIKITDTPSAIIPTTLRPRKSDTSSIFDDSDDEIVANRRSFTETFDLDYHPPSKQITGGKSYEKLCIFSVSASDCKKADQRLMSIRQQSELQRSTVGEKCISASPATVFRKPGQFRLEALKKCEKELGRAAAIQLCYDGKIINKMDRYILLGQYIGKEKKCEKVIAVKAFEKER